MPHFSKSGTVIQLSFWVFSFFLCPNGYKYPPCSLPGEDAYHFVFLKFEFKKHTSPLKFYLRIVFCNISFVTIIRWDKQSASTF